MEEDKSNKIDTVKTGRYLEGMKKVTTSNSDRYKELGD